MNIEIKELLGEEIKSLIEKLSSLDKESEEYSKVAESLNKLYRLKIEDDKNEIEEDEKYNRRSMDNEQSVIDAELKDKQIDTDVDIRNRELEIRGKQLREQSIDRWVNLGIAVFSTTVGILSYDYWFHEGLRFEEKGSIASNGVRNLVSRMMPKWFKN